VSAVEFVECDLKKKTRNFPQPHTRLANIQVCYIY
jgi:hypothetical protein